VASADAGNIALPGQAAQKYFFHRRPAKNLGALAHAEARAGKLVWWMSHEEELDRCLRSFDQKKTQHELPCFVMWPKRLRFPLDFSSGTSPR